MQSIGLPNRLDAMEIKKEVFCRKQFKCSECDVQDPTIGYEATTKLLMCTKFYNERDKSTVQERNISRDIMATTCIFPISLVKQGKK